MTKTRFCAECGATDQPLYENFCPKCFWKHHQIAQLKKEKVQIPYCMTCGSVKLSSGWTGQNSQERIDEVVAYGHMRLINTEPEAIIEIDQISEFNWIHPNPDFVITYSVTSDKILEFESHTEKLNLKVKLSGGSCKTCIKRKTGSGDVTVQFRAKNRKITQNEKDHATTIAFSHAADLSYESPEAYINDIVEIYGGLDFIFGNNEIAETFIESIKKQWIGHYEKNYKLITEDKDNRRIYSVTHLFRLPEVKIGDYVAWKGEIHQVHFISKSGVHLQSLRDQSKILTKDWEDISPLDPTPKLVKKMVVSEDIGANSYLLMDLQSYETEEVTRMWFPSQLPVGKEIDLIIWENKYYLPHK